MSAVPQRQIKKSDFAMIIVVLLRIAYVRLDIDARMFKIGLHYFK